MLKEKEKQNVEDARKSLQQYWTTVVPIGDWRSYDDDMPLMTKFVQGMFSTKNSKNDKLSYISDIVTSMRDRKKFELMLSERGKMMPPNMQELIKVLTDDTVNIFNDTTYSFMNEELRKEFVQGQYFATGRQLEPTESATELNLKESNIDPTTVVRIISNLKAMELIHSTMKVTRDDILPHILSMAAKLQSNQDEFIAFRKMLAMVECAGMLQTVLNSLYETSIKAVPYTNQPAAVAGVEVKVGVETGADNGDIPIRNIEADVNAISNTFKPFGNQVPARVHEVLTRVGGINHINDLKSIIQMNQTPICYSDTYLKALSCAYGFEQVPESIKQGALNHTLALAYVSKLYADTRLGKNTESEDIARGMSDILGANVVSKANYRITLAQAISYDMKVRNANATMALAKVQDIKELYNFAQRFLSSNYSSTPILSIESLTQHLESSSAYSSSLSYVDIDNFLKAKKYDNDSVPMFRKNLIESIKIAYEMR